MTPASMREISGKESRWTAELCRVLVPQPQSTTTKRKTWAHLEKQNGCQSAHVFSASCKERNRLFIELLTQNVFSRNDVELQNKLASRDQV